MPLPLLPTDVHGAKAIALEVVKSAVFVLCLPIILPFLSIFFLGVASFLLGWFALSIAFPFFLDREFPWSPWPSCEEDDDDERDEHGIRDAIITVLLIPLAVVCLPLSVAFLLCALVYTLIAE